MPLFTLFCCFSLFFSPRHDDRHYRNLNNVWLIIYHEGAHTARFVRRKNRQNRQKWLIYYSFLSYHINYITDEQKKKKKQKQKKKQVKILFFFKFSLLFCLSVAVISMATSSSRYNRIISLWLFFHGTLYICCSPTSIMEYNNNNNTPSSAVCLNLQRTVRWLLLALNDDQLTRTVVAGTTKFSHDDVPPPTTST